MSNYGVGRPDVPDKWGDPQGICDHGQMISMGYPFIDLKEVTCPVSLLVHQCGPVAV